VLDAREVLPTAHTSRVTSEGSSPNGYLVEVILGARGGEGREGRDVQCTMLLLSFSMLALIVY
jgi:hypothetical protein